MIPFAPLLVLLLQSAPPAVGSAERESAELAARFAAAVAELREERGLPGLSAAAVLADGRELVAAAGEADEGVPLAPTHRMLSGSVGKTYVAAVAHLLVAEGELDLDAPLSELLGEQPWYPRLPNADGLTLRHLLRHQSGVPEYLYDTGFFPALLADPERRWRPSELIAYVLDREPLFPPGAGWSYADANYVLVGMAVEAATGEEFYELARARVVGPLGLVDTVPSDTRRIERLAQGHVALSADWGFAERTLADGELVYNPQFEWCGGGWASTALDLARWARAYATGGAIDAPYVDALLDAVPAPRLGPGRRYGLGVILSATELGECVGHEGIMPGYLSAMGWFRDLDLAVAVQTNTDDAAKVGALEGLLVEVGRAAAPAPMAGR